MSEFIEIFIEQEANSIPINSINDINSINGINSINDM